MSKYKVSGRPNENQIIALGLAATEPMSVEDAADFGHRLIAECNYVRSVQAKAKGEPEPAHDAVPMFGVPHNEHEDEGTDPGAHPAPPVRNLSRRQSPQTAHRGSAQGQAHASVHSSEDTK